MTVVTDFFHMFSSGILLLIDYSLTERRDNILTGSLKCSMLWHRSFPGLGDFRLTILYIMSRIKNSGCWSAIKINFYCILFKMAYYQKRKKHSVSIWNTGFTQITPCKGSTLVCVWFCAEQILVCEPEVLDLLRSP